MKIFVLVPVFVSFVILVASTAYSQPRPSDKWAKIQSLAKQDPLVATPELLELLSSSAEDHHRGDILEALGRLWATPRERNNYRHPLPRTNTVPPEVKKAVIAGLRSTNFQIAGSASRAAYLIKIDDALPEIEKLGTAGHAILAAESLRNFDNVEAGRAVARLLQGSYSDPAAYGHLVSALPQESFPEAIPALSNLLSDNRDTRFNGLRVCDWAINALSRYLPDGPGFWKPEFWPRNDDEKNRLMDYLVETWKAYLDSRKHPSSASQQELAARLYRLADGWKNAPTSIYPPYAIRWARQLESLGAGAGGITAAQHRALKISLTSQEIRLYMKLIGFDMKRNGALPETPWRPTRYPESERSRFDSSNHLRDLWNHPYVYIAAPSHGAPFAIYSLGPNGIDNNGDSDDISSWKLEEKDKK